MDHCRIRSLQLKAKSLRERNREVRRHPMDSDSLLFNHTTGSLCFVLVLHCFRSNSIRFPFHFTLGIPAWALREGRYLYLKRSWSNLRCWELCKAPERKWDNLSLHQGPRPVRYLRLEVVGWVAEETPSSEPRIACLIDIKPNLVDR